jgi:hypothetical protein
MQKEKMQKRERDRVGVLVSKMLSSDHQNPTPFTLNPIWALAMKRRTRQDSSNARDVSITRRGGNL